VVKALCYKPEVRVVESSIYLIIPPALGHGFTHSLQMSTRSRKVMFLRSRARPVRLCRLSTQCGILNISKPYRLPRPATGISLIFDLGLVSLLSHKFPSRYFNINDGRKLQNPKTGSGQIRFLCCSRGQNISLPHLKHINSVKLVAT
jgi:hypothetical protein